MHVRTLEPTWTLQPTVTPTRAPISTPTLHWAEQIARDFINNVLEGAPSPSTGGITIYSPAQVMPPFPIAESLPTVLPQLEGMGSFTLTSGDGLGWSVSPDGRWY